MKRPNIFVKNVQMSKPFQKVLKFENDSVPHLGGDSEMGASWTFGQKPGREGRADKVKCRLVFHAVHRLGYTSVRRQGRRI